VIELTGCEIRIRAIGEVVTQAQAIARRLTADKADVSSPATTTPSRQR
jgi:hypothetical protein